MFDIWQDLRKPLLSGISCVRSLQVCRGMGHLYAYGVLGVPEMGISSTPFEQSSQNVH